MDEDWIAALVAAQQPLMTVDEVAAVMRRHPRTVKRDIAAGRIRAVRATEGGSSRTLVPAPELGRALRRMAGMEAA